MELAIVCAIIWIASVWIAYTLGKCRGINLGYREARDLDQLVRAYQLRQASKHP